MKKKEIKNFEHKVWIAASITALFIIVLLFFNATARLFILILAGGTIALYFRGLSKFINFHLGWKSNLCLVFSIVGSIFMSLGILFLSGATVSSQIADLQQNLPEMLEDVKRSLQSSSIGHEFIKHIQVFQNSKQLNTFYSDFFKTTFGGIGDIYIIILISIYFTVSPSIYRKMLIDLMPVRYRKRSNTLINKLIQRLTRWMLGKILAMAIVFTFTAILLAIAGLPMWLALSIIAGIMVFIPNFGPLAAAIPILLVGFSKSPSIGFTVGLFYLSIHVFEAGYVTPRIKQDDVLIPPGLILITQVFSATLIGVWGLIFATPLLFIIMVVLRELYTKPMNKSPK